MNRRHAAALAGVTTLVATAGSLLIGTGIAAAANNPTYEPTTNEVGTVQFYNAAGNVITTGNINDDPFAAYAVGSASVGSGSMELYYANPSSTNPWYQWYNEEQGLDTTQPVTTGPSSITTASAAGDPVDTLLAGGQTLAGFESDSAPDPTFPNIVQIRLEAGAPGTAITYDAADVSINTTTGVWTQIFPAPVTKATPTVTVTGNPNPATAPATVTYTATVAASSGTPTGTVAFTDTSGNITGCATQAITAGKATCTSTSYAGATNDTVTASYSGDANFNTATNTVAEVVNGPAVPATKTVLTIGGGAHTGDDITLSSVTTSTVGVAGTVNFYQGTTAAGTALNSAPIAVNASGNATFTVTGGVATSGPVSFTAAFTPTTPANEGSSSDTESINVGAAAGTACSTAPQPGCTDSQPITGTIPAGSISISTPYTTAQPLDVGTLALNATDTAFSGTAEFKCIIVTDTLAGQSPFTATAQANALTSGANSINGENVGMTNMVQSAAADCGSGNSTNNFTGTVTGHDNAAPAVPVSPTDTGTAGLGNAAHTILTGTTGIGTATYNGSLTLEAPTTTPAGTYEGTIVFTVQNS